MQESSKKVLVFDNNINHDHCECHFAFIVDIITMQVMRRLWSTLACLGITRVYIIGAEKVEKAYFGARILEPRAFVKELIIGGYSLEQQVMGSQL